MYNAMDEVIPGLWIGDFSSSKDADTLRQHNIHSVLSAMRGKVSVKEVRESPAVIPTISS